MASTSDPQARKRFHNTQPTGTLVLRESGRTAGDFLRVWRGRRTRGPIPVAPAAGPAPGGLHITWYGHATALVEIEGRRVLLDPLWSDRGSPVPGIGPKRLHPMPVPLSGLPRLDAIVISHDHYDHLDKPTVKALNRYQDAPFVVPLGVGAHLRRWGVEPRRIIELGWDERTELPGLVLTATEARHFSGRLLRRDGTLWSSWVLAGQRHRVFYSGDTGYFDGFARIGLRHGPFDATLIQSGAYNDAWPDIHMLPEQAVAAHIDLRGGLLIPVHWGTFTLAPHPWSEPVERLWAQAKARDVRLAVPIPGQRIDVAAPPELEPWWQLVA